MHIRVKRDRLTIFAQVGATDTIHKIKRSLFDSLVFSRRATDDETSGIRSEALATISYDGTTMYDRVQSADDIGLVHCRWCTRGEEDSSSLAQEDQQRLETTLLDDVKTLVDSKVENDDIVYIVLRRKDTGEFEDAGTLVRMHDATTEDDDQAEEECHDVNT